MLKIVHSVCCGMDLHKKFVIASIAFIDFKNVTTYKKIRFAIFNSDLKSLQKWLLDNNCTEVCMESTDKYWIPFLMFSKNPAMSLLQIQNMSDL